MWDIQTQVGIVYFKQSVTEAAVFVIFKGMLTFHWEKTELFLYFAVLYLWDEFRYSVESLVVNGDSNTTQHTFVKKHFLYL